MRRLYRNQICVNGIISRRQRNRMEENGWVVEANMQTAWTMMNSNVIVNRKKTELRAITELPCAWCSESAYSRDKFSDTL